MSTTQAAGEGEPTRTGPSPAPNPVVNAWNGALDELIEDIETELNALSGATYDQRPGLYKAIRMAQRMRQTCL